MGNVDYERIHRENQDEWKALTREPQRYEALLAGHYSECNHFVYELLQNAEDENATKAVIEYYDDKLVFYHNGAPFNEDDVRGVSSMLMGTKDKNSGQTIGRFGMGFKSVFKYTYQPEIYSDSEAFRIENFLLPVEIKDGWNYRAECQNIVCKLSNGRSYKPFGDEAHLTKIVIPFIKRDDGGDLQKISGKDVLEKLKGLDGQILLFLTNIRQLYWVERTKGNYALIEIRETIDDERLVTCSIEGTAFGEKEEITKYLRYRDRFDHAEMSDAEVAVAYKLNNRGDNVNEMKNTDVWVYFPTRENTQLPFLIHGSFETAVSREKLMTPSGFNDFLFDKLGKLIADSMIDLQKRKLITQGLIRRTLLQAFKDERENNTIPGLAEKVREAFLNYPLLPTTDGEYARAKELYLAVPFQIADLAKNPLIRDALEGYRFVSFNNERESNFTEYFLWLKDTLGIKPLKLDAFAMRLVGMMSPRIVKDDDNYKALEEFYYFCMDNRESIYENGQTFGRSGPYEQLIRDRIPSAWMYLRIVPILLNEEGELKPANSLYLASASDYKSVPASKVVKKSIAEDFQMLLKYDFRLKEFDNEQYVRESVIGKYKFSDDGGHPKFETEDWEKEYAEDIQKITNLLHGERDIQYGNGIQGEAPDDVMAIRGMVKEARIIRTTNGQGSVVFHCPGLVYAPTSYEEVDLEIYYRDFPNRHRLDAEFYAKHNVTLTELSHLGVIYSPFTSGPLRHEGRGRECWMSGWSPSGLRACPDAEIDGLTFNINYIRNNTMSDLARCKSRELLRLLLWHAYSLCGDVYYLKGYTDCVRTRADVIKTTTFTYYPWLYGKDGLAHNIQSMSKHDLSTELYGNLDEDEKYECLGFIKTEKDAEANTISQVDSLDLDAKLELLNRLARELGKTISDKEDLSDDPDGTFDFTGWVDDEFPTRKVRNLDALVRHVKEQFFCADPITYREVLRSIRVSKSQRMAREYAVGMYTNDGQVKICQMCRKPADFVDATEIANFGMELPLMNLCLCRNCSSLYKQVRDAGKEDFKQKIKTALLRLDIDSDADSYDIEIRPDAVLHFTQTHVAEIQATLRLIDEFGLPRKEDDTDAVLNAMSKNAGASVDDQAREKPEPVEVIVHKENIASKGCTVKYKVVKTGEIKETVIQSDKILLHNAMMGKKAGDMVLLMGKRYEIVEIYRV